MSGLRIEEGGKKRGQSFMYSGVGSSFFFGWSFFFFFLRMRVNYGIKNMYHGMRELN